MSATTPDNIAAATGSATRYSWYVLALLLAVYSCNWMDRYVLVILMEPIKRDLHLSDTALGFLSGFAFAAIYSFAGIPIARWADHAARRSIIAVGLAWWSFLTAASAAAHSFLQLTLARIGVALGESACSPPACSLIADYFPAQRRATAFAIYGVGISIGMGLGLSVGGWANESYGWRTAFALVGVPGLVLALIVRLTLREPKRGEAESGPVDRHRYSIRDTLRIILSRRAFLAYAVGLGLFSFSGNAFEVWTPTYLMRAYHLGTRETGNLTGLVEAAGGLLGTLGGGLLADRLGLRDVRWYLWMPATSAGLMVAFMLVFLNTSGMPMFLFYFLTMMCSSSYLAPIVAITQRIMPVHLRAQGTALLYLLLNLIGPGAGPMVAGLLNDTFMKRYGAEAVRLSLSITLLGAICGVALVLYASRHLIEELRAMRSDAATP